MQHKLTANDKLMVVFSFFIFIVVLPFLLIWLLIDGIFYKNKEIKEKSIVLRTNRFKNSIVGVKKYSFKNMETKLNSKIMIDSVKLLRRKSSSNEFDVSVCNSYMKKNKIKYIKIRKSNLLKYSNDNIKKQWHASKKMGGDHYIIIVDKNNDNKLELKFHGIAAFGFPQIFLEKRISWKKLLNLNYFPKRPRIYNSCFFNFIFLAEVFMQMAAN